MNSALSSVFRTQFRVYVEDTDMMGIVYHANYLRFFERARTEMFRELDYSLTVLAAKNYHFAIHEVRLNFLSSAYLDDCLLIDSQIIKQTNCSMVFEQMMQNQDNRPLCKAEVRVVCVDSTMKPQRLPFLI